MRAVTVFKLFFVLMVFIMAYSFFSGLANATISTIETMQQVHLKVEASL